MGTHIYSLFSRQLVSRVTSVDCAGRGRAQMELESGALEGGGLWALRVWSQTFPFSPPPPASLGSRTRKVLPRV